MKDLKYFQKLLFLFMMGFSLSFVCACGDDEEENEPFENPNQEQTGNGGTNPTDSIMSPTEEPSLPNDSTSDGKDEPIVSPTDSVQVCEAVDLGLSVLWASYNIGANAPEEYGNYYAWGETEEKKSYSIGNYDFYIGEKYWTEWVHMPQYEELGAISGTQYDVAHIKWGDDWRMPTVKEAKELIEFCNVERTIYNRVIGYRFTGPNGNSIFLPQAGYFGPIYDGIGYQAESFMYWVGNSEMQYFYGEITTYESRGCIIGLYSSDEIVAVTNHYRWSGLPIRPVRPVTD